ncbi:CBS domain-containing protein [Microlunatus elymi]|uniref:CBS domain-containing protein n=1 Tax=Microlunatus elymi TaxID=2596828 RepID=A0A516Q0D8_9ACTN|nr:CBS domain-containing protein [Microlunatus elymi]QDP96903.1 CBS domain-containing protein [Microlunatus elymi]
MRARDIQVETPMISRRSSVAEASRMIADRGKIGVVVADDRGTPLGMITALDVFRLALPDYLLDDSSLAATLDEQAIEELIAPLRDKTVAEVIADQAVRLRPVPTVDADATVLEIAAVLVSAGSMIAVVGAAGRDGARVVTLPIVLDAVLNVAGPASGEHG